MQTLKPSQLWSSNRVPHFRHCALTVWHMQFVLCCLWINISHHNRRSFPRDVTISAGLYKGLDNPAGRFSLSSLQNIYNSWSRGCRDHFWNLVMQESLWHCLYNPMRHELQYIPIIGCAVICILLSIVARGPFGVGESRNMMCLIFYWIVRRQQ
jgi:hypothetical protein